VDREGFVSPADLSHALKHNTALVTIMHSNNEVGTLQPIRLIGEVIATYNSTLRTTPGAAHEVLFHSDAAQSLGKVLVDVQHEKVDMLTIVGHKFGAPKGTNMPLAFSMHATLLAHNSLHTTLLLNQLSFSATLLLSFLFMLLSTHTTLPPHSPPQESLLCT
jgi:cysteine sulfinate desulfinase/cysteine desulfurase-like protein